MPHSKTFISPFLSDLLVLLYLNRFFCCIEKQKKVSFRIQVISGAFMLFTPKCNPAIQMLQQTLRLISPGNIFPTFCFQSEPSCCVQSRSSELLIGVTVAFCQLEAVRPFPSDLSHQLGIQSNLNHLSSLFWSSNASYCHMIG